MTERADGGRTSLDLYTAKEAAEILRVRQSWLERQAAARKIPFTMLGGCYRFTADHLAAIVRAFENLPTRPQPLPSIAQTTRTAKRPKTTGAVTMTGPLQPRPRHGHVA